MDNQTRLVITIIDEGHMQKSFSLSPQTGVTELLNHYRDYLCPICTNPDSLQLWHNATKIDADISAGDLSLRNGDIMDVYTPQQVTRGACPLPTTQVLPNVHYLRKAVPQGNQNNNDNTVEPADFAPDPPQRRKLRFDDNIVGSLTLNLTMDTKFVEVLEAWAKHAGKEISVLRLLHDGKFINGGLSVRDYEHLLDEALEDGEKIEVHYEVFGGGGERGEE